ncbi:MAG: hypothetical protein NUW23_07595 [Firmicutes bacterium]|nr:hypothetical protein [Bacillota bacterium]
MKRISLAAAIKRILSGPALMNTLFVVGVIIWGGICLRLAQSPAAPTRLLSFAAGYFLLLLKIGMTFRFGPAELAPLRRCKSVGADLAFAAVPYDISMYLAHPPVQRFSVLRVSNPGWIYLMLGGITLLVWAVHLFPSTVAESNPTDAQIGSCAVVGSSLYALRLVLYSFWG